MTRDDNVIELNSARDRLRNRPSRSRDDKRMHARLESDDRLFVQVVLSAADPDLVGTTVSCTAINLSVGGIQFRTDSAIPTGALLDLWVDIRSRPGKFFLAGEVRWTRPANDADGVGQGGWIIGVQLKSGAATDIIDWREHHAQASAR
jgi:Tfp pilus assembly protein PilZ